MQKCKIKSLEEVTRQRNRLSDEIKRDFKIQTVITVIVSILAIIVCFKAMSLAIDYEALEKEKQALEDTVETQSSMIADLEENCKDLYMQLENEKFGGNL